MGFVAATPPKLTITPLPIKPLDGITVWTRAAGQYGTKTPPKRQRVKKIPFAKLPLQEKKLFDTQYDKTLTYKGIALRTLLKRYKVDKQSDLALLHFENGIVLPVPIKLAKLQSPMRVFVATHWKKGKRWTRSFPSLYVYPKNKRALVSFDQNKVVSEKKAHPMMAPHLSDDLSIWRRVDSLKGIELVQEEAYYGQFQVSKSRTHKRGYRVYRHACQFCHGIRKVGASYGPDFTLPVSVHLYINEPKMLRFHLNKRSVYANRLGQMMPAMKRLTGREGKDVWGWMKGLWKMKKLRPYTPAPPQPKKTR